MAKFHHQAWLILLALVFTAGPSAASVSKQNTNEQPIAWTTQRFDDDDLPCLPVERQKTFNLKNLYSSDNTYLMMAASYLAYSFWPGKRQRILSSWGFSNIHIFDEALSSTNGFWAEHNEFIVIAFRGTQEPRDIITDVSVSMQPAFENYGQNILVHSGFRTAALSVWKHVQRASSQAAKTGKPLLIAGHSLGGAVALLSALELDSNHQAVGALWTYGAPKVGNKEFLELATRRLKQRWQKTDEESDPIPALPFTKEDHLVVQQWSEKFGHLFPILKTLANNSDYAHQSESTDSRPAVLQKVISKRNIQEIARGFLNHLPRSYVCRLSKSIVHQ